MVNEKQEKAKQKDWFLVFGSMQTILGLGLILSNFAYDGEPINLATLVIGVTCTWVGYFLWKTVWSS